MKLKVVLVLMFCILHLKLNAQFHPFFKDENPKWENIPVLWDESELPRGYMKVDTLIQSWRRVVYDEPSLRRLNLRHLKMRSAEKFSDAIVIISDAYDPKQKWIKQHADLYRRMDEEFWRESWRLWMLF